MSNDLTISQKAAVSTGYVAPAFTVKEVVTTPFLKMEEGQPYMVTFLTAPYEGEKLENDVYDGVPTMVRVRDLSDGVEKEMMLKSVLLSELEKLQERDKAKDLIDRSFVIVDCGVAEGKRYRTYGITEVELAEA